LWPDVDGWVVLDQVSEPDCGVVTGRVRRRLAELGSARPDKFILADSRERIGLFRGACLKPNRQECLGAVRGTGGAEGTVRLREAVQRLAGEAGRPVYCTCGEQGILLADPGAAGTPVREVPAYPVTGPIDPVGAGDSTSAGIIGALAAGARFGQAAAFGNLVASITVRQLGTTGTASPDQLRQRWREVGGR
jgi:sugar/nucleoside kinase (ribokinase family)